MNVCEVYTSVQGEGPNTGKPITFIRFGGCNLRCQGWGTGQLPDGTEVRGCDTVFAVYPEWSDTWDSKSVGEIRSLVPKSPRMVCLTGGEPLIQRSSDLRILAEELLADGYEIDLFSNGTRSLAKHPWTREPFVTVIMDWKLPGSEEGTTFLPENLDYLANKDAIKFVVKSSFDFDSALQHIEWATRTGRLGTPTSPQVWFGPVWDHLDPSVLASWVQKHYPEGRLNIQTHKYVWSPEERRV